MRGHAEFAAGAALGRAFRLDLEGGARRGGELSFYGRRAGESLEFVEYREYQAGDDVRHLDWNVYARSEQLAIKRFREELSPELDLIVDLSRSMDLPGSVKGDVCRRVAALLAQAALQAGFTLRLHGIGEQAKLLNAGAPGAWNDWVFDNAGVAQSAMAELGRMLRPGGARLLLSDLLWELEPRGVMEHLGRGAGAVGIVQLAALADTDPEPGHCLLLDVETNEGEDLFLTDVMIRAYQENYRRLLETWQRSATGAGFRFCVLPPVERFAPAALLECGILAPA